MLTNKMPVVNERFKKDLAPFEISERKTSPCVLTLPHTVRRGAALSVPIYIQMECCHRFPVSRFLNTGSVSKKPIKSEWLLLLLTVTDPLSIVKARHTCMSLYILSISKHSLLLHFLYSGHARFSPQTNKWKTSAFRFLRI